MGANPDWHNNWTTHNEQRYIDDLVSPMFWRTLHHKPIHQPAELIMNYIGSAEKRIRYGTFGEVDGKECINYAKAKLKKINKRG